MEAGRLGVGLSKHFFTADYLAVNLGKGFYNLNRSAAVMYLHNHGVPTEDSGTHSALVREERYYGFFVVSLYQSLCGCIPNVRTMSEVL